MFSMLGLGLALSVRVRKSLLYASKIQRIMLSMLGLGLGVCVRVRISVLYASNACKKLKTEIKTKPQK